MNTSLLTLPQDAARRLLTSLRKPTRFLAAVSGGSDSTGLLIALHRAVSQHDCPHSIAAATVDHALRPESTAEARTVASLCASLDIPHRIVTWQGDKPSTGISAAARQARYRLLSTAADELGATAMVTGHTADDQYETIAMRAARATQDNLGLSGMAAATLYDRRIWVLRPFLAVRRAAIRDYLSEAGIGWVDDPSNVDPHYERVRIRLGHGARPSTPENNAAERRRELSSAAASLVGRCATLHAGCLVSLSADARNAAPQVLRHTLATLATIAGGRTYRPSAAAMDQLMQLVASGSPGRMTLSGALVQLRRDDIYIMREVRDVLPRDVAAQSSLLWDGRYLITNPSDDRFHVHPDAATFAPPASDTLSPAMLRHIGRITPEIRFHSGSADKGAPPPDTVSITPAFPLFDHFLPDFDLPLAEAIARLFGRKAYLPLPA
ncbi:MULTISPECIES: tRNA lysidine(34) synthetase TilS [Alphaproteobacteria]|uniref:tRNA(Ile)-lysidine synthase n=2 Tax=Alphaproteobacteria TaxID=28211 RepID=A0A512HPB6_9HYPH|nr:MULTISPECIES: tRNA lysidine(34) synthetase TilS [Alphaproteobacteria]GEO87298.1 tRNA(Ile)-lysidine synthase [Ciceribacter naphthalenivorans]GLR22774.1 tRNA(Ile)-lysidine synthase [Ciceribacter naphthalenivorans]GLT05630.1 tRNA(Ile)-lysidine synthase [Sphingomonas psychrolutea]